MHAVRRVRCGKVSQYGSTSSQLLSVRLYSLKAQLIPAITPSSSCMQRISLPPMTRLIHSSIVRKAPATRVVDYLLADVGEGITECEIIKWFVEEGSSVEEFDVLVEVQSDKASVEITSRYAGVVREHCYKVGEVAKVGSALCKIEMQVEVEEATTDQERDNNKDTREERVEKITATSSSSAVQSTPVEVKSNTAGQLQSLATPAVRRIVREHGVDLSAVNGTGKSGRVTKEDVQAFISSGSTSNRNSKSKMSTSSEEVGEIAIKPLSGNRKAMFKAMSKTWTIPHFGYSDEIDISQLDAMRREMQAAISIKGDNNIKLTMLPFLIKAMSMTLYQHSIFRSTLNEETMSLHERQDHSISIALSSTRGLLTPTLSSDIRQASVLDIAEQIISLQRIIAERGLNQNEMGTGATVTLSNIGNIGGLYTFPLIPPTGQLLIGAVGRSRIMPRFDQQGNLIKALILPASFSADHRVVQGVELANFVQDWKQLLENPSSWLIQLR